MQRKIVILHEIYGVNAFIKEQAREFKNDQTEIECIELYPEKTVFSYAQEPEAYSYFINEVGFDAPLEKLTQQIRAAMAHYEEVVVIGFSVGATLAWRLSTLPLHRVICVYGSRIRHYLDVHPSCPTLVLLPSHEKSFDVENMKHALTSIPFVQTCQYTGKHGFMDCHNTHFYQESAEQAYKTIKDFL